jgi:hypothetical protein
MQEMVIDHGEVSKMPFSEITEQHRIRPQE